MGGEQALKLSVYFGERTRVGRRLLSDALLDLYGDSRVQLSIVLRGAQGFGAKHRLRTDRLLTLSEDLPAVAIAVDRRERVQSLIDEVAGLASGGLLTLERARIVGASATAHSPAGASGPPAGRAEEALKLSAYVGRYERIGNRPAFAAICQLLHERGLAGATVLLGVDGTRHGRRQRARFFARNERVPTMVLAVGDAEEIMASTRALGRMLPQALFTIERVRVCKRDGRLLQAPHPADGNGEHGMPILQKLTIITSEAATHEGRPVYVELMRRLRHMSVAGATALRGTWGFHGDHTPHGDRLLALRRHVPIVTVVVDEPPAIARAFTVADELTGERGLVTSELVPANIPHATRL
jgi:PII-like signaling protein